MIDRMSRGEAPGSSKAAEALANPAGVKKRDKKHKSAYKMCSSHSSLSGRARVCAW